MSYIILLTADAHKKNESKAKAAELILKNHYDGMPEQKKQELRDYYNRLTPDERKFTKRNSKNSY